MHVTIENAHCDHESNMFKDWTRFHKVCVESKHDVVENGELYQSVIIRLVNLFKAKYVWSKSLLT